MITSMADSDVIKDDNNIKSLVLHNRAGLKSLRDDHVNILDKLTSKHVKNNTNNATSDNNIKERINAVSDSLQLLEVGIAESGIMVSLAQHFDTLETERCITKLEIKRVKDENDWLRDELEDTERRLHDALSRLTELEDEKTQWEFTNELKKFESEANVKPMTPSKIPVGNFRLEEEKAINRALTNGSSDSNRQPMTRSSSPAPPSRIPKFFGSNYTRVKEKMEKVANEKSEAQKKLRSKSHKLSLTPASSQSAITSR